MANFVYFYIAENNQKSYLLCASTQNYNYQEQRLLLHDLNKITLWLTLHLITVLISYQLITCDSFHPFWKQNFRAVLRNMEKKWMYWNEHKWNSCGSQIHYTSSVLDSCRDESIVMNCFVEKWLRLEYLLWCCRHLSRAQKKKKAMHTCVLKSLYTFVNLKEVTWSQVAIRVTGQKKCYPTGPKLRVRFSESSEHHFLCFLPDECKDQYGIACFGFCVIYFISPKHNICFIGVCQHKQQ